MKHKYFFNVALLTSSLSTCISKQVGAVLVKDNRIIATGYNGVASGKKHCNEIFTEPFNRELHHTWSIFNELHAEENLISLCAKNGIKTKNSKLYLTLSPCITCAKIILAAGISEVHYIKEYDKDSEGLGFLEDNKIPCIKKTE
jgi:dCMP deaminase